jgi:NADP-dependent 3-hydroxy acid dehydrogenase YdfG
MTLTAEPDASTRSPATVLMTGASSGFGLVA